MGARLTAGDLLTFHRAGYPAVGGIGHSLQSRGWILTQRLRLWPARSFASLSKFSVLFLARSRGIWDLSSLTKDRTHASLEVQSLNPWTACPDFLKARFFANI